MASSAEVDAFTAPWELSFRAAVSAASEREAVVESNVESVESSALAE